MRRQPPPVTLGQCRRIVVQHEIAMFGEGIRCRVGTWIELPRHAVPLHREARRHLHAERSQCGEIVGRRGEGRGPERRISVHLARDGQGARMAQHHVGVTDPCGLQREPGAEGQVIDDDGIRPHGRNGRERAVTSGDGVPHEIREAFARLVAQRRHHAADACREEAAQGVGLLSGLFVGADDAGVAASSERQVVALEAEFSHDRSGRPPRGDDHAFAGSRATPSRAWQAAAGARRSQD